MVFFFFFFLRFWKEPSRNLKFESKNQSWIENWLDTAEERTAEPENRSQEITQDK